MSGLYSGYIKASNPSSTTSGESSKCVIVVKNYTLEDLFWNVYCG